MHTTLLADTSRDCILRLRPNAHMPMHSRELAHDGSGSIYAIRRSRIPAQSTRRTLGWLQKDGWLVIPSSRAS